MSYKEVPHIYYKKKYVGLAIQNVHRGDPDYLYTGGSKIEGCIKHLNNINSITGSNLVLTHKIANKLRINTKDIFKEPFDDTPTKGLLDLIIPNNIKTPIDIGELKDKLKPFEEKILELSKQKMKKP